MVKTFAAAFLSLLLLFVSVVPMGAETGNGDRKVRMGFFEFGGMFEGAREDAEKSGYCYEYMMQIATYTGWEYEFVYGSYAELYEMLKNGEIDILPYTNYNEQRSREVLFSNRALAEEEYYIAALADKGISLNSLDGLTISTLEGADYNDLLLSFIVDSGIKVNVIYYSNLDETWDAVRNGQADATVFTSNAYGDETWKCIVSFGSKPTYIAVAPDRKDLLAELNEAADLISIDAPALMGELYAQYFSDNPMRMSLSVDEQKWIDEHPVLHVGGFNNDAPYLMPAKRDEGRLIGLTVDIVDGIIQRLGLGIRAEYIGYDTLQEMEDALDRKEIDVIIPFYPDFSLASEHDLVISKTVRVSNMELVYRKGTSYSEALQRVATPSTKLGIYYVHDFFPQSEIIKAVSIQDALDKMLSGEATGAIAQNVMMHNIMEKYDDLGYDVLSEGCGTCFATRPENHLLIRILNRGLNYYTSAEISAIASLYNPEANVTTLAYLSTHKEAVVMLAIIFAILVILAISLIQLSIMKKKADEASRSKSAFLFNMSHDIRTPMNAIAGFTNMAKKNINDTAKASEYLDKIDASGQQLLTLINQVLEMSRIESGKVELEEKPISIAEAFRALDAVLSEHAKENGLEYSSTLDVVHDRIFADGPRMNSITLNLAGNAIKYTPRGGKITTSFREIESRKAGYGTYIYTVEDNGIGMSDEYQKRLFEPFTREKSSTVSKIQGAGLGMSIVKSLVDLMKGEIKVDSKLGKGTRFDVTVDLRIDDTPVEDVSTERREIDPSLFEGKRILLVEDNELNREIAKDILEEDGFIVDEAEDGDIAVEIMENDASPAYDAILMDVQMPRMNGYEATRRIRQISAPDRHVPIIAMTANAFDEDKKAALEAGMDEHLGKPIDVSKLKETLAKFLR